MHTARTDGRVTESDDPDAITALADFTRFPRWMWRNDVTLEFLAWLREHNATRDAPGRAGFYGLDLYSLHSSVAAVLDYLQRVDPAAAQRARYRYACFEDYGEEPQAYGYAATFDLEKSCEDDVIAQLVDLRRRAPEYATRDGRVAADAYFFAEQNARLVRNAEQYYRAMFGGRTDSWNLRDTHMMQTLEALLGHVAATSGEARAVVWAHNSHLGDARATRMGSIGQINLGQLVRERYGDAARLVGFTTHAGEVTAASDWGEPAQHMRVQPSLPNSYERLFHDVGLPSFALRLGDDGTVGLRNPRLERAIGVIYRPDSERISHYFHARLSDQFDVLLHIDETHALRPLERRAADDVHMPETFPSAL